MLSSRRSKPTPQDFIFALSATGVRSSQLRPHIALHVPATIVQPALELSSPEPPPPPSLEGVLGATLSGATEKAAWQFVPRHLPDLPSRHTWQSTSTYSARETDPRKVRERATEEGVLAEKALRKLMAARYASKPKGHAHEAARDMQSAIARKNEEVWEETLRAVEQTDDAAFELFGVENPDWIASSDQKRDLLTNGDPGDAVDSNPTGLHEGMVVNYDRRYWRQSARVKT